MVVWLRVGERPGNTWPRWLALGHDVGVSASGPPARDRPRPMFARLYARITAGMDQQGLADLRREMLDDLGGRVVEVGCGDGINFAHYPATVTEVQAFEPEPYLRGLALRAAARAPVLVTVSPGRGEALPLPADYADGGVLCLVLCSMPDARTTLNELARVIRPGGILVFLEHCAAETRWLRLVQKVADATVWPLLTGGCHTASDPLAAIRDAGFAVTTARRLLYPEHPRLPSSPHILGCASRPDGMVITAVGHR
jgi:ubiquinone/menaquinone biosynthesis C-methylase UbiE